jgi:hypothetical protein
LQYPADGHVDLFVSEPTFDLYSRYLYEPIVESSDYQKIEAGRSSFASGTSALELKRTPHVKRIGSVWYDKVEVLVTSGPFAGKRGFVISDCVVPVTTKHL